MAEIRIDPLTGLRAIVAEAGADHGLSVAPAPHVDPDGDPFAEGHEDRTAPELHAVRPDGGAPDTPGWSVRVVPSAAPALRSSAGAIAPEAVRHLFTALPARGHDEVIVNAPQQAAALAELAAGQVQTAVAAWRERMRAHAGAAYVHVCVDERAQAGAPPAHTHARLYALDFVPAPVARERERFSAHAMRTMGGNLLEDLVQEEVRRRARIVAIDDEAVLLCPYAARHPFALMLVPRRRRERFEDDVHGAALLHDGLTRLARRFGASPPLSLWVRTAPRDAEQFCWRIDIAPRLTAPMGLELGTGVHHNPVAPEQAAAELRDV